MFETTARFWVNTLLSEKRRGGGGGGEGKHLNKESAILSIISYEGLLS